MSNLDSFQNSFNSLVTNTVLTPIVEHLKSKEVDVTLEELLEILQIPPPLVKSTPLSSSVSRPTKVAREGGCIYTPEKGHNPGVPCGKAVLEGEEYCKTCYNKPRIRKLREEGTKVKQPILSRMPKSLSKPDATSGLITTKVTPVKSFISKPVKITKKQEEEESEEATEEETQQEEEEEVKPPTRTGVKLGGLNIKSLAPLGNLPPLGLKMGGAK
nr:transcription factor TFIIE beta domain-containing protein [Cedratvirus lena]